MTSGKGRISKFIIIRNAPIQWDEGTVTRKFSKYGAIEEVKLSPSHPNNPVKSLFVIVEFEDIDDAVTAVEDIDNHANEYELKFYTPPSAQSYVLLEKQPLEAVSPHSLLVPCSNSKCTKEIMAEGDKVYCDPDCYFECIDMMGSVNIYDKFIASMGRSGTGMLKDLNKIDKVVVTVDRDGNRSSQFYSPKK